MGAEKSKKKKIVRKIVSVEKGPFESLDEK